jgi:hypothetical protein
MIRERITKRLFTFCFEKENKIYSYNDALNCIEGTATCDIVIVIAL